MEFLVALAPIALILLLCGGMHFFMMRGMHGGHGASHEGPSAADDPDRVTQLESQVRRLQHELETRGPNADAAAEPAMSNAMAAGGRSNGVHSSHSGREYH